MSLHMPPLPTPENPLETVRLLQEELAQTNREVLMLTLELEQRVDELRAAEERYRRLAENAPDVIYRYEVRPVEKMGFVNPRVKAISGYSPEDFYNRPDLLFDLVHPEDRLLLESIFREKATADNTVTLRWRHKNGNTVWIEQHHVLVRNQFGVLHAVECIARDITERKSLEEQFRQAQKMEAIGRLAGGVAHDFNNLLTVINGYSRQALAELSKSDPFHEEFEEIARAGDRAAGLTRQLLAFSRRQMLQPQVFNVNEVVADMDKMLRRLLGEDVELATILSPRLEPIHADRGQLEQIIMNLAVNARDAMPNGGKLTIETAPADLDRTYADYHPSVKPGRYSMIAVSDSGQGMDEATKARIFEPFFTTKAPGQGTGLGLSTVYGIVEQSGGTIWVYSEPGKGTTFKIYFPRAASTGIAPEGSRGPVRPVGGSETILIVEDDESVAKLIRTLLQHAGYTVLEARNGTDALNLLTAHSGSVHLVVTDMVMPQMSGWELLQKVGEFRPGLKALFMSGYTDNALLRHGMATSRTPFLQKPFTPTELVSKVREVIDAR
jgi:two-component system, cell cycle sensor histidine kinase and response regulator CckA